MEILICKILIVILSTMFVSSILYLKFGLFKTFYHDFMGWCEPDDEIKFNGVGGVSHCKYCKKRIIEDGHGGWFPAIVQDEREK